MLVSDLINHPGFVVPPETPIQFVAQIMRDHDIGFVPVTDHGKPVGVITDRDIALRCVASDKPCAQTPASQVMSPCSFTCFEDQDVEVAAHIMGDHQIRRLPVLDRSDTLVGVLSLGDIAENASEIIAGETLGEIVEER